MLHGMLSDDGVQKVTDHAPLMKSVGGLAEVLDK